jgi:tetratricopeptide (TPR) repeat protein
MRVSSRGFILAVIGLVCLAPQLARGQRCPDSLLTYIVRDERGNVIDADANGLTFRQKENDWPKWRVGSAEFLNRGYFAKEMIGRVPAAIGQLNGKLRVLELSKNCGFTEKIDLELELKGKKMKLVLRPQALNDHSIDYMLDSLPFQEGIFDIDLTIDNHDRHSAYFYPASAWLKVTEADEAFYDGEERLGKKDYEQAIELFQKALALNPRKAEAAFFIGDANISLKRYDAAITALTQATKINPASATSYSLLGNAYRLNGQHKQAIDAYSAALAVPSKDEYWNEGWDKDTRNYLKKAQDLLADPNYEKAEEYADQGYQYLKANQYAQAIEAFQTAIRFKPDYTLVYGYLGLAYLKLNRNDEAIETLKRALGNDPKDAVIHGGLGQAYAAEGKYRESIEETRQAINLKPADKRWRDLLDQTVDNMVSEAVRYLEADKYSEARDLLTVVLGVQPENYSALTFVGVAQFRLQHYSEAVKALQQSSRIDPKQHLTWGVLGDVYSAQGKHHDALDAYKEALRLRPEDKRWQNGLKRAQDALNAPTKDAVEKDAEKPKDAETYYEDGMKYFGAKMYRESIESLTRAIKLKPDYAEAFTPLGIAYIQLEMYGQAVPPLREAIRLDPGRGLSHGALGQAYLNLGKNTEAFAEFKEAARLEPNREMWRDGLKDATGALDSPTDEIVKREAEKLWRLNNPEYMKDATNVTFAYQSIFVKRQPKDIGGANRAGSAGNSIDPLYSAHIKLTASVTYSKPREYVVDYKETQNFCFYKKAGETNWSAELCERLK